ncbi:MAG: hypothetical protein ABMB14_27210 [Myxococcota bacterium]
MNNLGWLGGLCATACGAHVPAAVPADSADGYAAFLEDWGQSRADLGRLARLEVVEVHDLWLKAPPTAASCYSVPCPDELTPDQIAQVSDQAARLAALVERAERAVAAPLDGCGSGDPEADLAALTGLSIVALGDLLLVEPEPGTHCYGFPCQEDIERANAANCATTAKLTAIATAARGL